MHMGISYFLPKFFFRVFIVVGLICLLVVGSIHGGRIEQTSQLSVEGLKHEEVIGGDNKHVKNEELDFNYMSKRRVPNGPDPFHNRRAGNSGRPPGGKA
ncbi:PREDICTED: CLAVATA3/ESR (CLE)-related protein 25-like [Lupinus angustifolius]|uniref:CLAVATA3/ESR (CLE)-related protein 25-like n=1 Tax=Lupinus angustifolius TaxID=3871 RepID=UPI00092E8DF4|nr:PREDICTED: CLAVATA3/ESR (CLE)-related protein 25-like [Lupinus angustifolius]